jgi:hypothetical protein
MDYMGEAKAKSITQMGKLSKAKNLDGSDLGLNRPENY